MLAALAASGLAGALPPRNSNADATSQPSQPPGRVAESSTSAAASNATPTLGRRRSRRLSAKNAAPEATEPEPSSSIQESIETSTQPAPEAGNSAEEPTASEPIVDSELAADFSDDEEIDADVFDEVDPDRSVSEKTVTLAIAEGWHLDLITNYQTLINLVRRIQGRSSNSRWHSSGHTKPLNQRRNHCKYKGARIWTSIICCSVEGQTNRLAP
jgi:hypothetical protein